MDDDAREARRLLDSARTRLADRAGDDGPPSDLGRARREERAAEAEALYSRLVERTFVAEAPSGVLGDVWHGLSLWAVLDPGRFAVLAGRLDDLVGETHGLDLRPSADRWGPDAVARVLADEMARRRDVWVESEEDRAIREAKASADVEGPPDDWDDEDDEDDDDSEWGVDTDHVELVDDLDDYLDDDRLGGGEFFEDEGYTVIEYVGEIPATARVLLELRGGVDEVRFVDVPYGQDELREVAEAVMDALDRVGVQAVSGSADEGCTGALVRHHSDGPATNARARAAADEVAHRTGIRVRLEVTDDPLAVFASRW